MAHAQTHAFRCLSLCMLLKNLSGPFIILRLGSILHASNVDVCFETREATNIIVKMEHTQLKLTKFKSKVKEVLE